MSQETDYVLSQPPPDYFDVAVTFPNLSCHLVGDESYAVPEYAFLSGGQSADFGEGFVTGPGIFRTGQFQTIKFVRGHSDKDKRQEGIKSEDLIQLLIERHTRLSGEVPDPRSQSVIMHLQSIQALLSQRVIDRTTRGVMNTSKS